MLGPYRSSPLAPTAQPSGNRLIAEVLSQEELRSVTPNTARSFIRRRPSYGTLESAREAAYNLDYPDDKDELARLQLDPNSRFYSRTRPRSIDLPGMLPYETETPRERARFLAHIVAHLYIAVKTLDLQGVLSVTAKDLAALKEFSDVDLALETNMFELSASTAQRSGQDIAADDMDMAEDGEEHDPCANDDDGDDGDEGDECEDDSDSDGESDRDDLYDIMETGESATQHRKSPKSAAGVSVRVWTQELLVWFKMKYDMPVSLRMSLSKVYYAICCCRGQHLNTKVYLKVFEALTKNVQMLRQCGMQLPWEPIYNEVSVHIPLADSLQETFEKKELSQMLKLAERASNFFDPAALPIIFERLGSQFSIPNAAVILWSMRLLPQNFVADYGNGGQDKQDIRHYILPLIYMWKKLSKSAGVDTHLTSALGRLAMCYLTYLNEHHEDVDKFGKFGVFSEEEFVFLINTLSNSLSINFQKFASMKTKFFHGFASALVFSLNGLRGLEPGGILYHIQNLINAIESFVHPSNSGEWSKPISKLILSIVYQFVKRYNMEREKDGDLKHLPQSAKLSDELVKEFVKRLLDIVRIGLQSKRTSVMEQYLVALEFLGHLDPNQTLGCLVPDIYESLDGVISTHRVITAMRCLEQLHRYFANTPIYRVHLARMLSLLLPGIDLNDLVKTTHALNILAAVGNYIPLSDLTNGEGDPGLALEFTNSHLTYLEQKKIDEASCGEFEYDPEVEVEAVRSSSASFKFLLKSFANRIFTLLENIPDPSKSNGVEKDLSQTLPTLIQMMLESMSDDIFATFRSEFQTFIFENVIHSSADEVSEMIGGIIKRDPSYFKKFAPLLIARIKEEVLENGAGMARTGSEIIPKDQALFWYVSILNESVGNAGEFIVEMGDSLTKLSFFLMENVKGRVAISTAHLLNQMLQGSTEIRLKESRLISPLYLKHLKIDERCWGGFQFDDYRFSKENLTFEWFVPTHKEVEFAVKTFKAHITSAISTILKTMKEVVSQRSEKKSKLDLSDELRPSFLYLGFGLSGISYLLDPSFEDDIPKLSDHESEPITSRLRLLNQIREMKLKKISNKEREDDDSVHESLEQIVKDIELPDDSMDIDKSHHTGEYVEAMDVENDSSTGSKESLNINADRQSDLLALRMSDSPSGSSSARHSPQLDGMDVVSPAITFRERKLYTSRYFFGDDIETRKSNSLYLEVHRLRHFVGKSLHYICKFMTTHLSDDTKLFKHLILALNVWFNDVGKERNLDHCHLRIPYSFDNEHQHINRVRKPFSRITFGSRVESYHLFRTSLHAASRTMSELDRLLIQDVTKLSCSAYAAIANPAHSTLVDVMKRVNGSYGVIVRSTLRHLSKAINEKGYRRMENALGVFELKKISAKLNGDYMNLEKFMKLLQQCLLADDKDVSEASQSIYKDLCSAVYPPRKCCIIEHLLLDAIKPPDEFIDLQVQAVTLAKEKKRKVYLAKLGKLQDAIVTSERNNLHWKTSYFNIMFLIELQVEFELEPSPQVFELVRDAVSFDHPIVSRLAVKGMTKLLHKLKILSTYDYNLTNAYDVSYLTSEEKVIETVPINGQSFFETWIKEVLSETPSYFWDNKFNYGWLFWGKEMIMVNKEDQSKLNLKEKDSEMLKAFGNLVDAEWFGEVIELWIDDNEANAAFQGSDVSFTTGIVMLMCEGYVTKLTFQGLLDLVNDKYVPEDKSCHIVICELISGILVASRFMSLEWLELRDKFLVEFLESVMAHDITPETRHVWNILFWYVPCHVDARRYPKVRDILLKFPINGDSDSAVMEATVLSYVRSMVSAILWGLPHSDQILNLCFNNFDNKYQAIRDQVGSLLAVVSFTFYGDSYSDVDLFVESCKDQDKMRLKCSNEDFFARLSEMFAKIESHRLLIKDQLAPQILQSDYIYCATTMMSYLNQALNTSIAVQFQSMVSTEIVPFFLNLIAMKEVCLLGNIVPYPVLKQVSQISFEASSLEGIIQMFEDYSSQDLMMMQYFAMGEFVEVVYFKNLFTLSREQRKRILNIVSSMFYHKSVEIREAVSTTFSGLIHATPPSEIESIIELYRTQFSSDLDKSRRAYKKTGLKNINQKDIVILHGATLGLGSLVHAFSLTSPPPRWIPDILSILSNKASGIPGIVGKSAKETLGKFKKTRQDTWHIDSKVFSEEQMQGLEGVLWKSYFI